jgi:hypothetical protein
VTDLCPAYTVALALHPCLKVKYLRDEWKDWPEWIEVAETTLQRVWETSYRGRTATQEDAADLQPAPVDDDLLLNHWQRKRRAQQQADRRDAMEIFQEEAPLEPGAVTDVIGRANGLTLSGKISQNWPWNFYRYPPCPPSQSGSSAAQKSPWTTVAERNVLAGGVN